MAKNRRASSSAKRRTAPQVKRPARGRPPVRTRRPHGSVPVQASPIEDALRVYEAGLRALQVHDYRAAHDAFSRVLTGFAIDRDVAERAILYLKVCSRHLDGSQPAGTLDAADCLAGATFALNAGEFREAIKKAGAVVTENDRNDHAHYILALAHILDGNRVDAMRHLARSIDLNPDCRASALVEADFAELRADPAFRDLIDGSSEGLRRRTKQK